MGTELSLDFCRQIETYLCQKNDGHLIRVTGPSFDLVARWAAQGIPLRVAFAGIDRYFERYYRRGKRRRPVKIDFCEADVLDVFDQWRRAVGIGPGPAAVSNRPSLPEHLERVVMRLSSARAKGSIGDEFDALIDRAARELEAARGTAGGLRGEARQALIERLASLDADLVRQARAALPDASQATLGREADEELAAFRAAMPAEAFQRAREAAIDRLVRERFGLPTISFL